MTYAPADLLAVQRYARDQTGQEWASLGIIHSTPQGGGYHEGRDLLVAANRLGSDYSVNESGRDAHPTDAASAFDFGGEFGRFLEFNNWVVGRCAAGDVRTRDIREVIYTPDGAAVRRFDRLGQRSSGDSSHLSHTHFSFYRDSEGRRDGVDNFLGLLREFFEGVTVALDANERAMLEQTHAAMKMIIQHWRPNRAQYVAAGGNGGVWDALGGNAFSAILQDVQTNAAKAATASASATVAMTAEAEQRIIDGVAAKLAPLLPTAKQVATEVANEQAFRLSNG